MNIVKLAWLGFFCFFSFASFAGEPGKDIKLLRDTPYELAIKQDAVTLRIPVILPEGMIWNQLNIYAVDINPGIANLGFAFEADSLANISIVLHINDAASLRPGTYSINLTVQKKQDSTGASKQTVKISLAVKPAAVTANTAITVVRVKRFPWGDYLPNGSSFWLYESSGESYLKSVVIRETGIVDAKSIPVKGSVNFSGQDTGVQPLKQVNIGYSFTGDFPLGKSTGNFEIVSPRLTAGIPVKMEITTKLGLSFLFLIILLGLVTGNFLRRYLESVIKVDTARLAAIDVLNRIREEQNIRPDNIFRDATNLIYNNLNNLLMDKTADKIILATTNAEKELENRINEFNGRLSDLKKQIDSSANVLEKPWNLPKEYDETLTTAKNMLLLVKEKYATGNAAGGAADVASLDKFLRENIVSVTVLYKNRLNNALVIIGNSPLKLPGVAEDISSFKTFSDAIPLGDLTASSDSLLTAIHTTNFKSDELVNKLAGKISVITAQVLAAFSRSKVALPNTASISILETTAKELSEKLINITAGDKALDELANAMGGLHITLKNAIEGQLNITSTDPVIEAGNVVMKAKIDNDISSGLYAEAAAESIQLLEINLPPEKKALKAGAIEKPVFSMAMRTVLSERLESPRISINAITILSQKTRRSLLRARSLQTIFSAIIIVVLGYVIFSENFIGTPADFASVFFWAFALDVSVATLTTIGAKVVKPS